MIRTQIQLTEEQSRRIKWVARQKNISMAQAIRYAVDDWLERSSQLTEAERWERSLDAVGSCHSGNSDLAENHDRSLAEAYDDQEE
jgi:Arc/MetJ-type ribon-helix-helix transcriptional regulator